jgi:hypothetical protein
MHRDHITIANCQTKIGKFQGIFGVFRIITNCPFICSKIYRGNPNDILQNSRVSLTPYGKYWT